MKKVLIALALIAVPLFVWNCSSDIVLEPAAPLEGEYVGTYEVTYGTVGDSSVTGYIRWTFTEEDWIMDVDTTQTIESCDICFSYGVWAYSNGIRLAKDKSQPVEGCTSCNEFFDPDGRFRKETKGDTIFLKQLEGTTYKQISLVRVAGS